MVQKMGGEGVPQDVGADGFPLDAGLRGKGFQHFPEVLAGHGIAAFAHEERIRRGLETWAQGQPAPDPVFGAFAEGNEPLLPPFAHDLDEAFIQIDTQRREAS